MDGAAGRRRPTARASLAAIDKMTGHVVWQDDLPAGATGAPMTYLSEGKQYIVVPVGGAGRTDGWVAFALH